jgi:serine/threonine protein kinase
LISQIFISLSDCPNMLGETISHYRIIEPLGEGGMGSVYLAEDISLGRRVAIKFLSSTAPEYRSRFLREARAVSALIHPNIATVFDYGETPAGKPYIVMELIDGEPLSEKLLAGSLPLPEAVRVVSAIAAALGEAHHHGVVHRDVKPSNVVINERGHVKVVDFGLVKQIHDVSDAEVSPADLSTAGARTRSDVIVGTPLYLSPEQATGKKVDGRSDLFALGAVLYECITGGAAFAGASVLEIGAQVIHFNPPVPSKLNSNVPPELDRITMKAIEKNPDVRYQSAEELIGDLDALAPSLRADSPRVAARQTKPLSPPRTHSASALTTLTDSLRQPRLSLGTFLIVIVAIAALIGGIVWWRNPAPYKPGKASLDWYNKGTEALRNGAFLQATKAFQHSIQEDPNFPLAHARLAEAWFELDDTNRAKDEMLKAQRLVPDRARLARSDALHLDAINATVTRDFPSAIAAYQELVKLTPDDPQVYVDLGRAYEKYDDTKNAIASYLEATNRNSQYAPAFLRVGTLYIDQADQRSASASLDKAYSLFEGTGNVEGQGEVAFQRGSLFDQGEKGAEANPHLMRAMELAKATNNVYLETRTLFKLGNIAAAEGNYEGSRELINKGLAIAVTNGIDNQHKRGLVDLGNSYTRAADYESALNSFRKSLELSEEQKDSRNAARAMLSLGQILLRLNRPDEAAGYIENALQFYRQSGYRKATALALNLLARAKSQKGDTNGALAIYDQQLKVVEQLGDQSLLLPIHSDLGITLTGIGRFTEALPHFEQNLAIAKSLNQEKDIGLALIHLANVCWQLGRFDDARKFLAETTYIVEKPDPAKNVVAFFHVTSAHLAFSEGSWDDAKKTSQKAIDFTATQFKDLAIEASYTLGLAETFSGNGGGSKTCEHAAEMANELGRPSLKAEALLALAQARSYQRNDAETLKLASEANQLIVNLGKPQFEWIAALIMAKANRGAGDEASAQQNAGRAASVLAALEQRLGPDNFNSYLNRQDVRFYREQLKQFLTEKP